MNIERVNILGVSVSAINMVQALEAIEYWIGHQEQNYICVTPAHGVMECQHDPELRRIFNSSGMTTPDGMSIVWLLRLRGYRHVSRVYGPDLVLAMCHRSVNGGNYRHFFYGGAPGVAEKLAARLSECFPDLQVVGVYCPPFRDLSKEEDQEVIREINKVRPDIVWVGISTPKQESWMAKHLRRIEAPVMIGVGAAFDFLSGTKQQAPRWIQRSGLEWLFRFANEPGRLWRRYIKYPEFLWLILIQSLGIKRFPTN